MLEIRNKNKVLETLIKSGSICGKKNMSEYFRLKMFQFKKGL